MRTTSGRSADDDWLAVGARDRCSSKKPGVDQVVSMVESGETLNDDGVA